MASLYQRENGIWWASHTHKGKRQRHSLETTDHAVARERMMQWVAVRVGDRWGDAAKIPFDTVVEKFVTDHMRRKKASTAKTKKSEPKQG